MGQSYLRSFLNENTRQKAKNCRHILQFKKLRIKCSQKNHNFLASVFHVTQSMLIDGAKYNVINFWKAYGLQNKDWPIFN